MQRISLKSTTALVLCLSLATTPLYAQETDQADTDRPFPCLTADGQKVENKKQFARFLIASLSDDSSQPSEVAEADGTEELMACGDEAMRRAVTIGGDDLLAAQAAAPADRVADVMGEGGMLLAADLAVAAQAGTEPAEVDTTAEAAEQASVDSEAADQEAADAAAAEQASADSEAADQEAADAEAAEQAAADSEAADQEAADAEAAEQAAADSAAAEQEAADAAAAEQASADSEAADQEAADAAAAEQASADSEAADQEAADAAAAEQASADSAAADQEAADAEAAEQAAADSNAAEQDAETVAQDEQPVTETAEEKQAREDARAERREQRQAERRESQAASAEASEDTEATTESLEEGDVRSAEQDFDTAVTGNTAQEANAESDDQADGDDGLSNFEKALLLGLGAAVVGSVLNNGDEVVSNSGDRVVVEREGELRVLKNDDVLLRQAGASVATQTFDDGSTRTVVTRENGSQVITIKSADGTVLRRTLVRLDGTEVLLVDDLTEVAAVETTQLPAANTTAETALSVSDAAALQAALQASLATQADRRFSLEQVRDIRQVRDLAPEVALDTINFTSGSAAIARSQADDLAALGSAIRQIVADDPGAIFLIEGHTDAVGDAGYNLALSDRRAETVALALTEYFQVPPENLITQGYGEALLKVQTQGDERANRRAAVRNITALLRS